MASAVHQKAKLDNASQALNLTTVGLKAMLVDDTYVDDPTRDFVDDGTADDPLSHEIAATGYAGGFAGAGRKALAGVALNRNDGTGKVELKSTGCSWSTLGGAQNATIGGVIIYAPGASDADSRIVAFDDLTGAVNTNGGDITYAPNGNVIAEF